MTFSKIDKDKNSIIAMRFFFKNGWTPEQAAAIVGNLTAESYLNPNTGRGDDGTALGLAQWRGERVTKFTKVIGKHPEKASLLEQLKFVDWELRNSHRSAGNKLLAAKTLEQKVYAVDKFYERSAGLHLDRRIKFATQALQAYLADRNLDKAVKFSMDGSDALTQTQPGTSNEPVPSSGFPQKQETFWTKLVRYFKGD